MTFTLHRPVTGCTLAFGSEPSSWMRYQHKRFSRCAQNAPDHKAFKHFPTFCFYFTSYVTPVCFWLSVTSFCIPAFAADS